jgi:FtsP/CotA-like multicopper oxidase with cupredoxin domain
MSVFEGTPRQRRDFMVFLLAVTLALPASIIAQSAPGRATSGGSPYFVPLVVDVNPDPNIVETTIIAKEAVVDIGNGVSAKAFTFNGQLPGPEFRLKVGDTVIVHFKNELIHPTGIHWHGIELANASDGTPLTQNQVPTGGTFLYKFTVTRPGIYWYHPHHHSSTNHLFHGLYGSIIVTDPDEAALIAAGTIPGPSNTRTLALSDTTVCKTPGTNDTETYDPTLPWAGGAPLVAQPGPTPVQLCETDAIDENGDDHAAWAAGDIPFIQPGGTVEPFVTSGRVNEGQTVLTNGKNVGGRNGSPSAPGALVPGAATLDVLAGQGLRLQIGNTATIRFFRLRLTDNSGVQIPLVRIGGQGGLLDSARVEGGTVAGFNFDYDSGEILLDPGDRADVVVAIPSTATGVLTLWTQDFPRTGQPSGPTSQGWAKIPTVPVAHFSVAGVASSVYTLTPGTALGATPVATIGAPTGTTLDPATFTPTKDGLATSNIRLTQTGSSLGVNDVLGEHDFPGDYTLVEHFDSARYAKLGDTLELTVSNETPAHHPFHLHGFSIQPLDLTKVSSPTYTWSYHEFRDNVDVPGGYTLRFRIKLDDRPLIDGTTMGGGLGRWVFHCHIFHHASFGMISEFVVTAADGNERPYVNANGTLVEVNEGQTATLTGKQFDPDGDAITLSASIGSVIDTGGGTWSWSYVTTDGPDSRIVYITATDAGGHKDQALFELKVKNVPPTVTIMSPANGAMFVAPSLVTVTASVTDPGTADVLSCAFNWGGAGPDTFAPVVAGTCSSSNTFTVVGTYTVTVTGSDDDGGTGSASVTIKIFTAKSLKEDVLAQATILLAGATPADAGELRDIGRKVSESLDPALWIDGNHVSAKDGNKVFDSEKVAVSKLMQLIKKSSTISQATLQGMIDSLVLADRTLAEQALADAIAAAGDPKKIADAQSEMNSAAADVAAGKFDTAIEHYKNAWNKALAAIGS